MQRSASLFDLLHSLEQYRIGEKITITDCFGNPGQFLINDSTGTDVQVTDFRIAHLSVRQTDRFARTFQGGAGELFHQP